MTGERASCTKVIRPLSRSPPTSGDQESPYAEADIFRLAVCRFGRTRTNRRTVRAPIMQTARSVVRGRGPSSLGGRGAPAAGPRLRVGDAPGQGEVPVVGEAVSFDAVKLWRRSIARWETLAQRPRSPLEPEELISR